MLSLTIAPLFGSKDGHAPRDSQTYQHFSNHSFAQTRTVRFDLWQIALRWVLPCSLAGAELWLLIGFVDLAGVLQILQIFGGRLLNMNQNQKLCFLPAWAKFFKSPFQSTSPLGWGNPTDFGLGKRLIRIPKVGLTVLLPYSNGRAGGGSAHVLFGICSTCLQGFGGRADNIREDLSEDGPLQALSREDMC